MERLKTIGRPTAIGSQDTIQGDGCGSFVEAEDEENEEERGTMEMRGNFTMELEEGSNGFIWENAVKKMKRWL